MASTEIIKRKLYVKNTEHVREEALKQVRQTETTVVVRHQASGKAPMP